MTPATATALGEAVETLYARFGDYRHRLAKEPRSLEAQAVFDQFFAQDARQVRPATLASAVSLLRLPEHHFGTLELKYFLPRLCELALEPQPQIGFPVVTELLGLFEFEQWASPERAAIWDYFLLFFRALLEEFSGRRAPPWGAYGYFRDLSRATEHVHPALLSWEMIASVTALLHLANFTVTWVEDRPLRERQAWGPLQTETIERWIRATGRAKLEDAAARHRAEPFVAEFHSALEKLK